MGRFQPFHLGHLKAIKDIAQKSDEFVVAIGSAQYSYEPVNPFTCGERLTMIRQALNEAKMDPAEYLIVPIPDLHRPLAWVGWVVSLVGHFDVVFSNEPVTTRVFREKGYRVESIRLHRPKMYSGREIRRRMRDGEGWKNLVPKSVASYIEGLDGVARIKDLGAKANREDHPSVFRHYLF